MNMEIFDDPQGSPEWYAARLGLPTASQFQTIISGTKDAKDKKTRTDYLYKLAGEILTGQPMDKYNNALMDRGHEFEDDARNFYALSTNTEPKRVGFIKANGTGCSPDSLVGEDGGLEIKIALPHVQIDRLLRGELPSAHKAQVHGNIWIANRKWWDFVSYCPQLPMLRVRVIRDEAYNLELQKSVISFNDELSLLVKKIKNYGNAEQRERIPAIIKPVEPRNDGPF